MISDPPRPEPDEAVRTLAAQKAKSPASTTSAGSHVSCRWTILEFLALVPEDHRAQPRVVVWRVRSVVRPLLVSDDEGISDAVPYLHVAANPDPELRARAVDLPHGLVEHPGVL